MQALRGKPLSFSKWQRSFNRSQSKVSEMGLLPVEAGTRFTAYVEELRDFCALSSLPHGSAEDLRPFTEHLSNDSHFRKEVSSLVRATIFRENVEISQAELLEILVVAVGGAGVDIASPELRSAVQELQLFLTTVFASLWTGFPDLPSQTDPLGEDTTITLDEQPRRASDNPSARSHPVEEVRVAPDRKIEAPVAVVRGEKDRSPEPAPRASRNLAVALALEKQQENHYTESVLAELDLPDADTVQAHADTGDLSAPEGTLFSRVRSVWRDPEPNDSDDEGVYPEYTSLKLFAPERRPFWYVGICGILLGIGSGVFLWRKPTVAPSPSHTTQSPLITSPAVHSAPVSDGGPFPVKPIPDISAQVGSAASLPGSSRARSSGAVRGDIHAVSAADWDRALGLTTSEHGRPSAQSHRGGQALDVLSTPSGPSQVSAAARLLPHSAERDSSPAHAGGAASGFRKLGSVSLSASGPMFSNLISAPVPAYPEDARSTGVQGDVVVQAVIGMDGNVIATRAVSGPLALRQAAQNAVRRWQYRPFLVGGRPSMISTQTVLEFRLQP